MIKEQTPVIRQAGEGEQLWFAGGGVVTFLASVAETGGAFSVLEDRMARGKTTPLHIHPDFDEALYVLEGEILVHVDGQDHPVGAGGLAVAPRGVPHAFLVTSETARLLGLMVPGNGEAFFRSACDPATSDADAARPPDIARLQAAAERSDSIEILGPPPFDVAASATR
jgi:quercetin dioxygenase-like cupin family protein